MTCWVTFLALMPDSHEDIDDICKINLVPRGTTRDVGPAATYIVRWPLCKWAAWLALIDVDNGATIRVVYCIMANGHRNASVAIARAFVHRRRADRVYLKISTHLGLTLGGLIRERRCTRRELSHSGWMKGWCSCGGCFSGGAVMRDGGNIFAARLLFVDDIYTMFYIYIVQMWSRIDKLIWNENEHPHARNLKICIWCAVRP